MQLKLANVFRRCQEERRGYETERNKTNLHTLSNCNISSGSKYHLGWFKMSPLPLSCFCLIPVPLASGRVVRDLINCSTSRQMQGFPLQPYCPDKYNDLPHHHWFQRSAILFSSGTHSGSCSPWEKKKKKNNSNFKGLNCP